VQAQMRALEAARGRVAPRRSALSAMSQVETTDDEEPRPAAAHPKVSYDTTVRNVTPEAKALPTYPTAADADEAMRQGFGYGDANAAFLEGHSARLLDPSLTGPAGAITDDDPRTKERAGRVTGKPEDHVTKSYQQAQLAANRSAVAALGFDPRSINLLPEDTGTNLGGLYNPETDQIYSSRNLDKKGEEGGNMVHESVHRGLEALRKRFGDDVVGVPPSQDERYTKALARYLSGRSESEVSDPYKYPVTMAFEGKGANMTVKPEELQRLEALAAQLLAERRPRGPR